MKHYAVSTDKPNKMIKNTSGVWRYGADVSVEIKKRDERIEELEKEAAQNADAVASANEAAHDYAVHSDHARQETSEALDKIQNLEADRGKRIVQLEMEALARESDIAAFYRVNAKLDADTPRDDNRKRWTCDAALKWMMYINCRDFSDEKCKLVIGETVLAVTKIYDAVHDIAAKCTCGEGQAREDAPAKLRPGVPLPRQQGGMNA